MLSRSTAAHPASRTRELLAVPHPAKMSWRTTASPVGESASVTSTESRGASGSTSGAGSLPRCMPPPSVGRSPCPYHLRSFGPPVHICTQCYDVTLMACKDSRTHIWREVQYTGGHAADGSGECFWQFTFDVVQQPVSQTSHDCQTPALWSSACMI